MKNGQAAGKLENFQLQPFCLASRFAIDGTVCRNGSRIGVLFRIVGELGSLLVPEKTGGPRRKDDLWRETCLEFFLREEGHPAYWEFNLCPNGDWNAYSFSDYRQGMAEEKRITTLPIMSCCRQRQIQVGADIDLTLLGLADVGLQMALSAVTLEYASTAVYWALAHPADKPDFHASEGFRLFLPPCGDNFL